MCEIEPPSFQLLQTYCMPVLPLCGEVVAIVWLAPETQVNVVAFEYVVPSTVNERPDGLLCTVTEIFEGLGLKLAVSLTGPFIVTEAELLPPEYEPLPLPAQLLKL